MDPKGPIRAQLIFDPKALERYFEHAASAGACLEPLIQSVDRVNQLGAELAWEDLRAAGRLMPASSSITRTSGSSRYTASPRWISWAIPHDGQNDVNISTS